MSSHSIALVYEKIELSKSQELAQKLSAHLIDKGIIQKELSKCTLGDYGHEPRLDYKKVIEGSDFGLLNLKINGVSIISSKRVYHSGGNGLFKVLCPHCRVNIIDSDWGDAMQEWALDEGPGMTLCPHCYKEAPITEYTFIPTWGFGNLGIIFWNWPNLKENFIADLERLVGQNPKIVYGSV